MKLVVDGYGKSIRKRDNQIVIKEDEKELDFFLAKDLEQILILGKGSITFDALELLAKNDVDCLSIDWRGDVKYRLASGENKNIQIRKEQYYSLMDKRSGFLAKAFIKSKIENQKATLGTLAKSRENNDFLKEQRDKLSELVAKLDKIRIMPSSEIQSKIFGVEGQASVEYWKAVKSIIPDDFNFSIRSGRYAQDPINAMLNYSYAILQSEIWKSLHLSGLDPYCGFLHSDRHGRPSLIFDLMEEFRQQLVDKTVLSLVNKNQITLDDFSINDRSVLIKNSGKQILIQNILNKLSNKINYGDKKIAYCDIIMGQSRKIVSFLIDNNPYVPFYLRW